MPVIGHTFAGIIIGQESAPGGPRNRRGAGPVARALWIPVLVGLSYLPDVVTQIGLWLGYRGAQSLGHSMPLGIVAGLILGLVWARTTGGSPRLLSALAVGSILLHDGLDLLQDAQRLPFWPFWTHRFGVEWLTVPNRILGEVLFLGIPFAVYEAWRVVRARRSDAAPVPPPATALSWIGRGLVVAVLLSACGVLYLRLVRERQMTHAQDLYHAGRYAEALLAVDEADRWPMSSVSGDMLRGQTYDRLGDVVNAEVSFMRAYERAPEDFWAVASLAEYYASHGTAERRRQRSAPYAEELKRRFPEYAALQRVLTSIERSISKGV